MAKEKVTITVDRRKLDEARHLAGDLTASAAIDEALSCFLRAERIRRDIAAYTVTPPTDEEVLWSRLRPSSADLADDTDWEALYEDVP